MSRTLTIAALLMGLFWQALAFSQGLVVVQGGGDMQHAGMHWHDEAHHHHDDGSISVDDSAESVLHVVNDHGCSAAALLVGTATLTGSPRQAALPTGDEDAAPAPFVDGLLRPPRSRADQT